MGYCVKMQKLQYSKRRQLYFSYRQDAEFEGALAKGPLIKVQTSIDNLCLFLSPQYWTDWK